MITVTLFRDQVLTMLDCIKLFLEEEPQGETLNMLHSILQDVDRKLRTRLLAGVRPKHSFRLKVHEVIAIRRAAMVGIELFAALPVQNNLREVVCLVDPLVPMINTATHGEDEQA